MAYALRLTTASCIVCDGAIAASLDNSSSSSSQRRSVGNVAQSTADISRRRQSTVIFSAPVIESKTINPTLCLP